MRIFFDDKKKAEEKPLGRQTDLLLGQSSFDFVANFGQNSLICPDSGWSRRNSIWDLFFRFFFFFFEGGANLRLIHVWSER